MALDEHADNDGDGGPPAGAHGQLVEPLLQRQLVHHAVPTSEHGRHGVWSRGRRGWRSCGGRGRRMGAEK